MTDPNPPRIAQAKGFHCEVVAGRRYFWCSCGRSANQPFCDGSHAGTGFEPMAYLAEADGDVIFCGCKHSGTKPFCDGTHNNLPDGYAEDDPDSIDNRRVRTVSRGDGPFVRLDGDCYIFSARHAAKQRMGSAAYCAIMTPAEGAQFQSQFYVEVDSGVSPVIAAHGSPMIVFVCEGEAQIEISGRFFPVCSQTGISICADEAFRVHNDYRHPVKLFVSTRPANDLSWPDVMPDNFNEAYPDRLATIDSSQRHKMAARFFQILISRQHGSTDMTQFIGNIPFSKAEPHRHLYEEAVIFLRGEGVVWTETRKAVVGPGDVLFLPRKQIHSIQCTRADGLDVVGVICPGDNPSISY